MKKNIELLSGSYPSNDITFLLSQTQLAYVTVEEKEYLIQTKQKHYSEMLSKEVIPSTMHLQLYQQAMDQFSGRVAREVLALAKGLMQQITKKPIVLVSLVRAGVPLGVCLLHALQDLGVDTVHYGISIIRDKGIDRVALDEILQKYDKESIVFVDGWTGKGAITNELIKSLAEHPSGVLPRLVVLADPCGRAWLSSSQDDWLIPFGILGATVSGLISRSIWQENGLHAAVFCDHLASYDESASFVEKIDHQRQLLNVDAIAAAQLNIHAKSLRKESEEVIQQIAKDYQVTSINYIKPGIAEATRAIMRRVPEHVIANDRDDPDIALLMHLAQRVGITVEEKQGKIGQYRAITIIKTVG